MRDYNIVRLIDLYDAVGEDSINKILSDFSCKYQDGEYSNEVENFLKNNAIDFSKRKISITYLIINNKGRVVGLFTLTHKPIIVKKEYLKSKRGRDRMEKHAKYDSALGAYSVSAFLIAQFGKNYNMSEMDRIDGVELMEKVLSVIEDIQMQIGGGIVFLECEDHPKLIDFYTMKPNNFFPFGERNSEGEGIKYIQMMRFL